jgi:hypothetical protein
MRSAHRYPTLEANGRALDIQGRLTDSPARCSLCHSPSPWRSQRLEIAGFSFDAPDAFRTEEMTVALRGPLSHEAGPSIIVQSRKARLGASLEELAAETIAELAQSVAGMKNLSRTALDFADGGKGILLGYDLQTSAGRLRQYFVMRLNGDRLCSMTVSAPYEGLNDTVAAQLMKSIASIRPA